LFLMLLASAADTGALEADLRLSNMTALYEHVCLKAFPDDRAVEALLKTQDARELSPEEVKVTMGDDPARGWALKEGWATVWVEFPPFHACSVRWNTPQVGALDGYRAVVAGYETAHGGFGPIEPYDTEHGDIHIHAIGERRTLPDQTAEALFVIDQHVSDPKRREAGETGIVIRFVHQFTQPSAASAK